MWKLTNPVGRQSIADRGTRPLKIWAGGGANYFVRSKNGMIIWNFPFCILFQTASTAEPAMLTKCGKFELKCTKMHLVAGLRQGPLGSLSALSALCAFRWSPAIGVSQRLGHTCGTHYRPRYDIVTDSLREFKRLLKTHLFGDHGDL